MTTKRFKASVAFVVAIVFVALSSLRPAFHELAHVFSGTSCSQHSRLLGRTSSHEVLAATEHNPETTCPFEKTAEALSVFKIFETPVVTFVSQLTVGHSDLRVASGKSPVFDGPHLTHYACGPPAEV